MSGKTSETRISMISDQAIGLSCEPCASMSMVAAGQS